MEGKGKKGQFYLVAAVVMISILLGITSIGNFSKTSADPKLKELKQEILIESEKVIDYAYKNDFDETQINSLLENFATDWINFEGKDKNLYFIFGKKEDFTLVAYQAKEESVRLFLDSIEEVNLETGEIFKGYYSDSDGEISLEAGDTKHEFELVQGENFYFVISKKEGGEAYVVTG